MFYLYGCIRLRLIRKLMIIYKLLFHKNYYEMYHFKRSMMNKSYVTISALIALAVAQTAQVCPIVPMSVRRITGGDETKISVLPYQVSIQLNEKHICGGSIISSTRVLTAAQCTIKYIPKTLYVRAGSDFHGSGGTVKNVHSICTHPEYKPPKFDNDVSVLRLLDPLTFTDTIQPISLVYPGSVVDPGLYDTNSGWGSTTSHNGPLHSQLKKIDIPKVPQQYCRRAYENFGNITDSMTCYGWSDDKGFCRGDIGGPLAIGRVQVGIASLGIACTESSKPQVYADLTKAIIRNHINSC